MNIQLKNYASLGFAFLGLLIIPLIATFTWSEFNWDLFDFILFGSLLFVLGASISWASRTQGKKRLIFIFGFILLFLLIWAELAVGIIGSPLAGS